MKFDGYRGYCIASTWGEVRVDNRPLYDRLFYGYSVRLDCGVDQFFVEELVSTISPLQELAEVAED